MPVMINPRKKRKKAKRRSTKRRISRKRKRNPVSVSAFGTAKRRKKAGSRKTTKRRKKAKATTKRKKRKVVRKVTKTPKRRKTMAKRKKRGRRKTRRTIPLYAQFRKKRRRSKKANPTKKRRRRYRIKSRRGKIAVRRGKRRAYVSVNPKRAAKNVLNQALYFGIGMLGNTFLSNLISSNLGGTVGFLQNGLVPSALITGLSWFLFGKKNTQIVAGSVVATAFEAIKLVLPADIKEMVGLGQIPVFPGQQVYGSLPSPVQGFQSPYLGGFTSEGSLGGVEEYMGDVEQYPGGTTFDTTLQDEEYFGM